MVPGLNEFIFTSLKAKINTFKAEDKVCMVCLDEISIKSNLLYNAGLGRVGGFEDFGSMRNFNPAQNATVVMVRGLWSNWKQPISFYLVHAKMVTCLKQ